MEFDKINQGKFREKELSFSFPNDLCLRDEEKHKISLRFLSMSVDHLKIAGYPLMLRDI